MDVPPETGVLDLSVVIAVYNRGPSVLTLLEQLASQTLAFDRFEVVVVDDGSAVPIRDVVDASRFPFALTLCAQPNQGPAAARHRGITLARAPLVLSLDDDMRVAPGFLAAHLEAHEGALTPRVVLGRLRAPDGHPLRLFERYQLAQLDRLARRVAADPTQLQGGDVYSGNVSFARALYFSVGGFDQSFRISEDAELGIRFEQAGATLVICEAAWAGHASDHTEVRSWMSRSVAYGHADSRVAQKHVGLPGANPWRFLYMVNPVSQPLLRVALRWPALGRGLARLVLSTAQAMAWLGAERLAMVATTLAYGLLYYTGVREAAGTWAQVRADRRAFLQSASPSSLGRMGRIAKCLADIAADRDMLHATDARYRAAPRRGSLLGDAVQRIGFQLMIAYRVMRLTRQLRLGLLARIQSRLIRHVYGADIHWDAELAPGVVLVHGVGLVISHAARVETGCILFQHVTLGESMHPASRRVGAPTLEPHVHVAPGAVLLGPIVIGRESKIAANAVVTESVPARTVVESPTSARRARDVDAPPTQTPAPITPGADDTT
jgi:serine acetyltransferase/GT2 family glycosyltransferase